MKAELELPHVGATAALEIEISLALVNRFAEFVGDDNPIHMDAEVARSFGFRDRVAHGMSYACFLSTLIGTRLPGPGSLWASQTYRFISAVYVGDKISLQAEVIEISTAQRLVKLSVTAINQANETVMEGESVVYLPRRHRLNKTVSAAGDIGKPVALIAGASGTLGRAIASKLAQNGFNIALCGRNSVRLSGLAEEINSTEAFATPMVMDLSLENSVTDAVSGIETALGHPDLVIHCASSRLENQAPHESEWSNFQDHIDVQLKGMHHLLKATIPAMLERGRGQFILIGSSATHGAPPRGLAAYTAAKSAAASLIKSVAVELAPRGIRANIVSPHFMTTDLTVTVPDKQRKLIAAQTPLKRLIEVDEVATAVGFLADPHNGYMNGHDLLLDGGAVMT
jgi:3-oxoacyl-[acyl-carrier protein] reductase